jgi:hypothetical protein
MGADSRRAWGFALALGLSAAASGGCELTVGDSLPPYNCLPGQADVCPADSVCVPSTQLCTPRAATCTATSCGADGACDLQTLKCVAAVGGDGSPDASLPPGDTGVAREPDASSDGFTTTDGPGSTDEPDGEAGAAPDAMKSCRGIGCTCSSATDCNGEICADSLTVTSALYTANMSTSFCTQACCTSTDCPGGSVCFATGAGGNYCVAPGMLQRSTSLGSRIGGAACTSNADCRSGLCSQTTCADTCCSAANSASECATGTTCHFGTFPGNGFDTHASALCGVAATCTGFGCDKPCRNTAECGTGQACYDLPSALPSKDIAAACTTADGPGAEGSKCTSDFQCATNFCDTMTTMSCSDVCFADSDCPVDGWRCRPAMVAVASGGSYSVLTCGP